MKISAVAFILALASLAAPSAVIAQTPFPMLGASYPVAVKRGETTVVTVSTVGANGLNLNSAYKALFQRKGVTAEVLKPEKETPVDPKKPWELPQVGSIKMKVTVAADAEVGATEFRLATARFGVSTIGQVIVSDEKEILRNVPADKPDTLQKVELPCAISGKLERGETGDGYEFHVEAGREYVFTVECARLLDKVHHLEEHADPLLVLRDANGVILAQNDDFYRADPLIDYKFTKTGDYRIQLRDVNYKGNANWSYHLVMTDRPWVLSTSPCVAAPGKRTQITLSGYNLGDAKTAEIDVPADAPVGVKDYSLKLARGMSNPVQMYVSPDAIAQNVAAPFAPIQPMMLVRSGDGATLHFLLKKGQTTRFTMIAQQIGSTLDGEMRLMGPKGNLVAQNDDENGKDPEIVYGVPEDGDYSLEIADLSGVTGDRRTYALEVAPSKPDFTVKCDPNRAMIAPGNKTCVFVQIQRRNGFGGEVKATLEGLPPGVTASPLTIPPSLTQGTIILSADAGAKVDATLARVVASAVGADNAPLVHQATPITEIYMPGGGRGRLPGDTLAIGVTDQNDISVSVDKPAITLKPGEEVKIEVTIARRPDYTKATPLDVRVQHFEVFCNPLPPGVTIAETTIAEGQNKGTITLKAAGDAKPIQNLTIPVMGFVSLNFVMKTWYVAPVTLTIEKPAEKAPEKK